MNLYLENFFDKIVNKLIKIILNKSFFWDEMERVIQKNKGLKNNNLYQEIKWHGNQLILGNNIKISDPCSLNIGHNVYIGDDACFVSEGGLTIGDNTHIGQGTTIYTIDSLANNLIPIGNTNTPKPVMIGKNVWIGMNVSIIPGVRIGDGAIIGMGTVVTNDVPALAVVGNQPCRVLKYRDPEHYRNLEEGSCYGGVNGKRVESSTSNALEKDTKGIFFVVTTGRSGSTTISNLLSQHSKITCLHEPRTQLIRLSTEFAHGEKSYEQTREELYSIYCNSSTYPTHIYGESDQKFWNLIEIIAELIPSSKFIWLIRDGRDVVSSTYARRWFDRVLETKEGNATSPYSEVVRRWIYYRLDGAKCNAFSQEEWDRMSVLEKNCWYWSYVNRAIEKQLKMLPTERWHMIKLEEMKDPDQVNHLLSFLGTKLESLEVKKTNSFQADYPWYEAYEHWSSWSNAKQQAFIRFCGREMEQWYPEWRAKCLE